MEVLGQNPNEDLKCAYCDRPAETWDHVVGLVENQHYSGFGHTIGNLLPCRKQCNSSKGNKDWRGFVTKGLEDKSQRTAKINQLENYFSLYRDNFRLGRKEIEDLFPNEMKQLSEAHNKIIELMKQSDKVAAKLRDKIKEHRNSQIQAKT